MNEIEWDESYSVKNQDIDAQHQEWIAILNRLHNSILFRKEEGHETITEYTLKAMLGYVEYHFKFEEGYLKKINYPELGVHRRLHKDFASQIYQYNRDISQGKTILNTEIIKILKDWIMCHIREEDKKYSLYADNKNTLAS